MSDHNQIAPVDRLFRAYKEYTANSTEDTLFVLLSMLHSLDDRLEKVHGRLFFKIPEYITLKALRNYFHHEGEVRYSLRVQQVGSGLIPTDLLYVCLVKTTDCVAAIKGTADKFRNETLEAFGTTTKVYGKVVDINPCIFNCVVKFYEVARKLGIAGESAEFAEFAKRYGWETENDHSHYVTGTYLTHLGLVDEVPSIMEALFNSEPENR
jgi:hypothetical protein